MCPIHRIHSLQLFFAQSVVFNTEHGFCSTNIGCMIDGRSVGHSVSRKIQGLAQRWWEPVSSTNCSEIFVVCWRKLVIENSPVWFHTGWAVFVTSGPSIGYNCNGICMQSADDVMMVLIGRRGYLRAPISKVLRAKVHCIILYPWLATVFYYILARRGACDVSAVLTVWC